MRPGPEHGVQAAGGRGAGVRTACLAVGAASWLWLGSASGSAQADEPLRRVDLVFAGDAIESSGLAPVLEELLGRIDVELRQGPLLVTLDPREVLRPDRTAAAALARIWIEIGPERTTIYLVDADWERILIRHVPTAGALDEVGREQVAHIVQAAVEALLSGARIGFTRTEARAELGLEPAIAEPTLEPTVETPAPPSPGDAEPPSELGGDVHLGYGLQLFADGPSPRHGAMLLGTLLVGRSTPRLALAVGVDVWPSTSHEGAGARLDLRSLTVRLEAGVDLELLEGTDLRVTGGLSLDVTAIEPQAVAGSSTVVSSAWDAAAPMLGARVMVRQRIWRWISVVGALVLDVDLLDTRYVVAVGPRDETVVDPWLVRPALFVGVGGHL